MDRFPHSQLTVSFAMPYLQMRLAQASTGKRGGNVKFDQLIHLVRHDTKKKQRVKVCAAGREVPQRALTFLGPPPPSSQELLLTSEEIQEAKKPYKENEMK